MNAPGRATGESLEPTPDMAGDPAAPPRHRHGRSSRGVWTIVAVFAVGLAVLGGLMLAPRAKPPAAPADVPWGAPGGELSLVTYDLSGQQVGADAIAQSIKNLARSAGAGDDAPDFLAVVHIGSDDAMAWARALGMHASYRPQHHQRVPRAGGGGGAGGASDLVGVCLLSKHPLYEGGPLRIDRKRSSGVSAVAVVAGRKFRIACVYAAGPEAEALAPLREQQKAEGGPPTLLALAGDAAAAAEDRQSLDSELTSPTWPSKPSGLPLFVTRHWRRARVTAAAGPAAWRVVGGAESSTVPTTGP